MDGRYLAYYVVNTDGQRDLWYQTLSGDQQTRPFLQTAFNELRPILSPDGRLVAYPSDANGRFEVYVKSFPDGERTWQVSVSGGVHPRWNGRGDELYYVEDNALMAVPVKTRPDASFGLPRRLFSGDQIGAQLYNGGVPFFTTYDASSDGQHFVIVQHVGKRQGALTIVQNWYAEFKDRK